TTYQIEYKYRSHGGGSQDFAVSLGTSQSSGSMSTLLHSVTNISSSSFATAIAHFTVPADGIYYFGLHSQQNTGSGYGVFDDVELRGIQDITFYNLQIKSSDAATFNQNVAVQNNLSVDADGTMNLDMNEATVEGTVSNNGTLQQIRDISDGSGGTDYEFLILRDAAAANIKYYGTQITPDAGLPLGSTTVTVRGNQNCTTNASDPLVQRCFDITPTNDESATIKYWFIEAERNGETLNTLQVWDYNGGGWVSVGTAASYGSGCGTDVGCWLQWTGISTYSPMVVGSVLPTGDPGSSSCNPPTAPTAMGINRVGTNVTIDWSGGTADFYEVWHGLNAPYFTPGADCAMAANCTVAATSPHSSGVWSTPGNNYAYVVVAGNSCGTSETAVSRVGDFSFDLEAGTP
ncbi:MAG: hypothetical protein KAG66_03725, partial [Methylococcales bacterium]|nr:hypothetical protein [Methylococcales bacterium]